MGAPVASTGWRARRLPRVLRTDCKQRGRQRWEVRFGSQGALLPLPARAFPEGHITILLHGEDAAAERRSSNTHLIRLTRLERVTSRHRIAWRSCPILPLPAQLAHRSEERRVGKECRSR